MTMDILKRIALFVILCLVQALVLNYIHLFNCATPLLYVYFVIQYHRGEPRWSLLLWSFFLGLAMDTFTNTPGVAAASMTLIGLLQPYLLELFIPRDSAEDLKPSLHSMNPMNFVNYVITLVVIYCIVFYVIEAFNIFNWLHLLECVGGSSLITLLVIFAIESVKKK